MKKNIKIISGILASVIIGSTFISCNKTAEVSHDDNDSVGFKGRGVHQVKVEPLDYMMIENQKTEYKLLLPEIPTEYEMEASLLINEYVEKALGVTFPVLIGADVDADEGKYISLGDTSIMRKSGISVDVNKLGSSGYRIVTKADDIYLSGARNTLRQGTYYAAQDFLKYTIDWVVYTPDEIQYTVSSELPLYNFDITEIPEFDSRRYGVKNLTADVNWQRYMRMEIVTESRLDYSGHSHFEVLPASKYAIAHPTWYAWEEGFTYTQGASVWKKGQLCLSNEEMFEEFVKVLVEQFKENPTANFVHLGHQDNSWLCSCDNCTKLKEKYNTNNAGLLVLFTNKVARKVTEIIQQTEPDRVLQFEMFAYLASIEPPVNLVNGEYVAHHNEVIPDENIVVQFTPLGSTITERITHESNEEYYEYLKGWYAITDNISTWTYNTNFHWLLFNHKNWDILTSDLRTYSSLGIQRVYDQNANLYPTAQLCEMRIWVESQLMWNPSLNYQDLVEEFVDNYYGPAAPQILEMINAMTTYYEYLRTEKGCTGGAYFNLDKKSYWQFPYVESIRQIIEKAYQEIEPLKNTDPKAYEKYYWRIGGAYLENLYMQLEYHADRYGENY